MNISVGIASTTHVDRQGDRMAKSALDSMAEQAKERYIPYLIEHDPNRQIGVVLCGRVESMSDGEFALVVVVGIFENERDAQERPAGAPNTEWEFYEDYLAKEWPALGEKLNRVQPDVQPRPQPTSIEGRLERYLDSTSIWTDGRVYQVKHPVRQIGDLRIEVYRDHPPPHFHVRSKQRRIDARFHLDTLELIGMKHGSISSTDQRKIKAYFEQHPAAYAELRAEHTRMQQ